MDKNLLVIADLPPLNAEAVVLFEQGRPVEFHLQGTRLDPLLGNIYAGKVEKVSHTSGGAFVRLGSDLTGFLPLKGKQKEGRKTTLRNGDEILVQIETEALKQKLPRLTRNLTLAGRFLVLSSEKHEISVSRKLPAEEKERLTAFLKKLFPETGSRQWGVIARTNSAAVPEEEMAEEYSRLAAEMDRILSEGKTRTCFSLLYSPPEPYLQLLRNCPDGWLDEVVTDLDRIPETTEGGVSFRRYSDKLVPLYKLYSMTSLLERMTSRTVHLSSGGFLVIEQTEAFVCIDVNTGRYDKKQTHEEAAVRINKEAAEEAARQIRLRRLSGTILIDFINVQGAGKDKELISLMQAALNRDPNPGTVIDITALGIMEIIRKKTQKSFAEELRYVREL